MRRNVMALHSTLLTVFVVSLLPTHLVADAVTTSASCQVQGSPSDCNDPGFSISAFAAYNYSSAPDASFVGTVESSSESVLKPGPGAITLTTQAAAEVTSTFYSNGPQRSGYLDLDFQAFSAQASGDQDYPGAASFSVRIGSVDFSCFNKYPVYPTLNCAENGTPLNNQIAQGNLLLPFALGEPIAFDLSSLSIAAGSNSGSTFAQSGFRVGVSLLEADGVTPAPFSITPEPSTGLLILLPCVAACFFWRKPA